MTLCSGKLTTVWCMFCLANHGESWSGCEKPERSVTILLPSGARVTQWPGKFDSWFRAKQTLETKASTVRLYYIVSGVIFFLHSGHCERFRVLVNVENSWRTAGDVVGLSWLFNVPAACMCISGTDLLRQLYFLPHWDRDCRSNYLTRSQNTEIRPASPRVYPITPGAW